MSFATGTAAHRDTPEWRSKVNEVRQGLTGATHDGIDDGSISRALEESDGNIHEAITTLKTSSGTPPATTANQPPTVPTSNAQDADSAAELKMMFPALEPAVIASVLESHASLPSANDRLDAAIGDLLQLADPSYKPAEHAPEARARQANVNLDEEFARSLQLQEEEQAKERQRQHQQTGGGGLSAGVPYQPRQSRRQQQAGVGAGTGAQSWQQQQPQNYEARTSSSAYGDNAGVGGNGEGPGIDARLEQLATVGKQRLGAFWSTAKSKIDEFQQAQQQRQQQQQQQQQRPAGVAGTLGGLWEDATAVATGKKTTGQQQQGQGGDYGQDAFQRPGGGRGSYGSASSYHQQTPAAGESTTRRWHPSDSFERDATTTGGDNGPRAIGVYGGSSGQAHQGTAGYSRSSSSSSLPSTSDDGSSFRREVVPQSAGGGSGVPRINAPAAIASSSGGTGLGSGMSTPPRQGGLLQADRSSTPPVDNNGSNKIDLSKIGMLPKRRVSLLSSSPGKSTPITSQVPAPAKSSSTTRTTTGENEDDEFTR